MPQAGLVKLMTTANDLITKALKLNGKLGQGQTLSSYDADDCLDSLNAMLDSWWNERLSVYQILRETFTLVASDDDYTIGTGGQIATTRPIKITNAFITADDIDYPMEIITVEEYDAIQSKTVESDFPLYLYYQPSYPLGIIYLYPVPSATHTLNFDSWKQIQSFADLTTEMALPPGYQRAIEYNLSIETAPLFGVVDIPPAVTKIAIESKAAISRINSPKMHTYVDAGLTSNRGYNYNINADR